MNFDSSSSPVINVTYLLGICVIVVLVIFFCLFLLVMQFPTSLMSPHLNEIIFSFSICFKLLIPFRINI